MMMEKAWEPELVEAVYIGLQSGRREERGRKRKGEGGKRKDEGGREGKEGEEET